MTHLSPTDPRVVPRRSAPKVGSIEAVVFVFVITAVTLGGLAMTMDVPSPGPPAEISHTPERESDAVLEVDSADRLVEIAGSARRAQRALSIAITDGQVPERAQWDTRGRHYDEVGHPG